MSCAAKRDSYAANARIYVLAFLTFGVLLTASAAHGATITLNLTDYLVSNTTTSGINLTSNPTSAPALPADGTFSADSGTVPLSLNEGNFLRWVFTLPTGFTDLSFSFNTFVDDEFALYLNDTVIALQADTTTDNFVAPLPGFNMATDGSLTSVKLEYVLLTMQSLFQSGTNELTLFATDTLISGSISSVNGTLTFDAPTAPVPEPGTLGILSLSSAAVLALRRRRRSRALRA